MDLRWADLRGADLRRADLGEADLRHANLALASLNRTKLRNADLRLADLQGADLSRADLRDADLNGANLGGANVRYANLALASLNRTKLQEADLTAADLSRTDLRGADLQGADLARADLRDANLIGASLPETNLSRAQLGGADMTEADLSDADLTEADLHGANLSGANLSGANLSGAALVATLFAGVDLGGVVGLESVRHDGPSSVGVDTLYLSQGQIPEAFLRGCGVPDLLIRYLPDLTVDAQSYYAAFISYSHADSQFADRLHGDLFVGRRINCWKDSHDLRAGEPIAGRIRRAIRAETDKVLLLCSEASLNSEWVDDELNTIFGLERELGIARRERGDTESRIYLVIPIDLDGYLRSPRCDHEWTDRITARVVIDLRDWRTPASYQAGLERVVRALETGPGTMRPGRILW